MFKSSKFCIVSSLSTEECYLRIKASIETSLLPALGSKPLVGKITQNRIKIRKRINYRNSFQTQLDAELSPIGSRTKIEGKMGLNRIVKVLMTLIIGLLVVSELLISQFSSSGGLVLIAFCIGLVFVGKFIARDEAQFLKDYLNDSLQIDQQSVEHSGGVDG